MTPIDAVQALAALAQETRLAAFRVLVQQGPSGMAAGEIAAAAGATPAVMSFHLKELTRVGLVGSRQQGRFVFYTANFARMNELLAYLSENCCAADAGADGCAPAVACVAVPSPRRPVRRARSRP